MTSSTKAVIEVQQAANEHRISGPLLTFFFFLGGGGLVPVGWYLDIIYIYKAGFYSQMSVWQYSVKAEYLADRTA